MAKMKPVILFNLTFSQSEMFGLSNDDLVVCCKNDEAVMDV